MRVGTWNLNHRVGKTRYRQEAALAVGALGVDIIALTEFSPGTNERSFRDTLARAGLHHQSSSALHGGTANRVLVAARTPIVAVPIAMPDHDDQMPANVHVVRMPETGLVVIAVRIPAYTGPAGDALFPAWSWLESQARTFSGTAAVIVGDLNASPQAPRARGGEHFRRMLGSGWRRADSGDAATFHGRNGRSSVVDHLLHTPRCSVRSTTVVTRVDGWVLADGDDALSDHAALVCDLQVAAG